MCTIMQNMIYIEIYKHYQIRAQTYLLMFCSIWSPSFCHLHLIEFTCIYDQFGLSDWFCVSPASKDSWMKSSENNHPFTSGWSTFFKWNHGIKLRNQTWRSKTTVLLLMEEILHQLIQLVVYPIILLGFYTSEVVSRISSITCMFTRNPPFQAYHQFEGCYVCLTPPVGQKFPWKHPPTSFDLKLSETVLKECGSPDPRDVQNKLPSNGGR